MAMETYEASTFVIDHPQDWMVASTDMMGVTIFVTSSKQVEPETFLQTDPAELFSDAPGLVVMQVPPAMAAEGNLNLSPETLKGIASQEGDFEVLREGEITIDGVTGYEVVAQGKTSESAVQSMGIHMLILESETGVLTLTAFSPEQDLEENLAIFDHMAHSIDIK